MVDDVLFVELPVDDVLRVGLSVIDGAAAELIDGVGIPVEHPVNRTTAAVRLAAFNAFTMSSPITHIYYAQ